MGKKDTNAMDTISLVLVLIASLNLGVVGLFSLNVIELILGTIPMLMQIFNVAVGVSGLYMIYKLK